MFAGRYRNNKKETLPVPHSSHDAHSPGRMEPDEPNSLPQTVTETMSIFSATPYALSMLDGGALSRNYKDFLAVHERLEHSMDVIVNDYHEAFNAAIQRFSSAVDTIADSKKKVEEMRGNLEKSKEWLECKRFDLLHLWVKSIQLKEMSRILDAIDDLQKATEKIDALANQKSYLQAVKLLVSSQRAIKSSDLAEIGALDTIRQKLEETRESLTEKLLEELQNHLYLKTTAGAQRIDQKIPASEDIKMTEETADEKKKYDDNTDPELDQEQDSYKYMQVLIESLHVLNKLPDAFMHISERLGLELYNVVERTLQDQEIKEGLIDPTDFEQLDRTLTQRRSAELLINFLQELFKRFQAVLEGHIFLMDCAKVVSKGLIQTDGIYTAQSVGLAIQSEIKALLCDYFTNSDTDSLAPSNNVHINELLKEHKRKERSHKQVFQINSIDPFEIVKDAYLELNPIAKANIASVMESTITAQTLGIVDKYGSHAAAAHRLLVESTPAYILVAFKPTASFTRGMEELLNIRVGSFQKSFLNDFVLNVYIPMIEQQSAVHLVLLLQTLTNLISQMPVYKVEIMKIMQSTYVKYLEKCRSLYDAVIVGMDQDATVDACISSSWANLPDIRSILSQNTYLDGDSVNLDLNSILTQKEIAVQLKLKGDRSFHRSELIFEPRKLQSLATLYYGLHWLDDQVSHLRGIDVLQYKTQTKQFFASNQLVRELSDVSETSLLNIEAESTQRLKLDLTPEMAERFNAAQEKTKELMNLALFTLRLEIRCHTIFFLDLAIRELISHLLFTNIKYVRRVNENGVTRMIRNIDSLQQNLTNFSSLKAITLFKVKSYVEMLKFTGDELMNAMNSGTRKFTFDDYKIVLDLIFIDKRESENAEDVKEYESYLYKLKEYFIKHK
ncbi:Sec8 exocyst complex component-specific domain-containing protein [Gorgonomyces haynaldii]|nr:Sec8 exocyst complex component-specific domain-containing protein [Gorgonomyces haynaldii]